jgi:hypothetical protein
MATVVILSEIVRIIFALTANFIQERSRPNSVRVKQTIAHFELAAV